mmetsp:Transcript_15797/g.50667  ORF Transcript_15797/g.50667 Transcript_15797/m.50667 type:complete len:387 (-) Transcript_15797:703-1863(-)
MAATSSKSFNEQEYVLTEHGTKLYTMCGMRFEVTEEYQVRKAVGQGAYGLVCAGRRRLPNGTYQPVAIKKIPKAFEDTTDCKRLLREIKIQLHFSHLNVLGVLDILPPVEGKDGWKDVYLVCDLMDTDLHYIIHSKQPLEDQHFRYFLYQIMRGVHALHAAHVLHRDLKPGNLLVNKNCDLKICDFGLARGVDPSQKGVQQAALTEYVVTRWYRAPELLVENETYGPGIDIWSVGCILAEFLGRKALFPGRDYLQQLRLIIEALGPPSDEDLSTINNPQAVEYIKALPKRKAVNFASLYPNANKAAIDLLQRMLAFDARKRISAAESLEHEYLVALHNVNDEPDAPPFDFHFEKDDITERQLRGLIWDQLRNFHPEVRSAAELQSV